MESSEDDEPLDPEAFAQELIDELDSDQRIYLGFYYAKGVFGGLFNSVAALCTSSNGINQFCHVDLIVSAPVSILKPNLMKVMNSDCEHPYRNDLLSAGFFDDSYSRRKLQLESENVQIAFSALWGQKLSCRVLRKSASNSFQREVRDDDEVNYIPFDVTTDELKQVLSFALEKVGSKYNQAHALMSALPCIGFFSSGKEDDDDTNELFCSQFCAIVLKKIGVLQSSCDADTLTPNSLFAELKKK